MMHPHADTQTALQVLEDSENHQEGLPLDYMGIDPKAYWYPIGILTHRNTNSQHDVWCWGPP